MTIFSFACSQQTDEERELRNLDKAIGGIENRHQSEIDIIAEEQRILIILRENLSQANAESVKDKISREILLRESVIEKAEGNIENQKRILKELYFKKDSIINISQNIGQ